jgi:hypothetical protein
MSCDFIRELLSAQIDDELTRSEIRRAQQHLDECQECYQVNVHFVALDRLVRADVVPDPSVDLWRKIHKQFMHERARFDGTRMFHISSRPLEKLTGTACFAAYVAVTLSTLTGRRSVDVSFDARVDLGADITCIPRSQAEKLMPLLLGRPVLVRSHDGSIKRTWTYRAIISIHGYPDEGQLRSYRLEKGVLLTDSDIGLIGMDIVSKWNLTFDGVLKTFSVECIGQPQAINRETSIVRDPSPESWRLMAQA